MRMLRCVWHGTRKPAGPNCATQERPAAIRACLSKQPLPECPVDDQDDEKENDWNGTGAAGTAWESGEFEEEENGTELDGMHGENDGKEVEESGIGKEVHQRHVPIPSLLHGNARRFCDCGQHGIEAIHEGIHKRV